MDLKSRDARIAQVFIRPDKRSQFLSRAASRQHDAEGRVVTASRKKLAKYGQMLACLEHWLDPRCPLVPLGTGPRPAGARAAFAARSSDSVVYVMSDDARIDGMTMELDDVLTHLSEHRLYGTLVVNVEYSLVCYEQCELVDLTRLLSAVPSG